MNVSGLLLGLGEEGPAWGEGSLVASVAVRRRPIDSPAGRPAGHQSFILHFFDSKLPTDMLALSLFCDRVESSPV